jgi:hypothetical protein
MDHTDTSFSRVMGEAVIGQSLYYVFPTLILLLIVFNAFNVYTLIARMFGLERFEFESDFSHENIEEGKRLLQRARLEMESNILNSNSKDLREYRSYKWEVPLG